MKFTLMSQIGNLVIETDNERKRDRLLDLGYKLVEKEKIFEKMTVTEIDAYAKEKNIDISSCKNKDEKISAIKAAIN